MRYADTLDISLDAFYVGEWLVEPSLNRITGRGTTAPVEPKVMQLLRHLAQRPGQVCTREALLDTVWPDTIVTDHALTRAVSELRKAFAEDTRRPAVIETIPKTGYRLIAPVTPAVRGDSDGAALLPDAAEVVATVAPSQPRTSPAPPRRVLWVSVAVLITLGLITVALAWKPTAPVATPQTRPFTTLPGLETAPAFSPDGSRIAYVVTPERGVGGDLYIRLVDGASTLRLTNTPAAESLPVWSPDGTKIVFYRRDGDACALLTVPTLGGTPSEIAECVPGQHGLAWSPDGRWLAYAAPPTPDERSTLHRLDLETMERQQLTTLSDGNDGSPAFSPDGRALAFQRNFWSHSELFLLDLADLDAEPVQLTEDRASLAGYDWTPDGDALVFSSDRSGLYRLWEVAAAGGAVNPYGPVSAWDPGSPVFAPAGDRMAYVEWFYEANIWRLPGRKATQPDALPQQIVVSSRTDFQPVAAQRTGRIAFVSNRSGNNEIWTTAFDGNDPARLTFLENTTTQRPRWSPGGEALVFHVGEVGQRDVYVVDADGSDLRRLTDEASDDFMPYWSADGQWIYITSNRDETLQTWKIARTGSEVVQVTTNGGGATKATPDGNALVYLKASAPGIWRLDLATDEETLLYDGDFNREPMAWQVVRDGVYFMRNEDNGAGVYFLDFAARTPLRVATLPPEALFAETSLSVTPDEAWILYASLDRYETDLMLVENVAP